MLSLLLLVCLVCQPAWAMPVGQQVVPLHGQFSGLAVPAMAAVHAVQGGSRVTIPHLPILKARAVMTFTGFDMFWLMLVFFSIFFAGIFMGVLCVILLDRTLDDIDDEDDDTVGRNTGSVPSPAATATATTTASAGTGHDMSVPTILELLPPNPKTQNTIRTDEKGFQCYDVSMVNPYHPPPAPLPTPTRSRMEMEECREVAFSFSS